MKLVSAMVFTFAALQSQAADPADVKKLELLCQTILCRPPTTVRLTLDSGKPFETKFEHQLPIVQGSWFNILPGETLFVEAELKGDKLESLKAVKTITRPTHTLVLKMWQEPGKSDTYLNIKNPFPVRIKYRAGMMYPDSERVVKTSSCPVSGGLSNYEHWPHAIFQLVLADFHVLPAAAEGACTD